jgi:hypothetical protein
LIRADPSKARNETLAGICGGSKELYPSTRLFPTTSSLSQTAKDRSPTRSQHAFSMHSETPYYHPQGGSLDSIFVEFYDEKEYIRLGPGHEEAPRYVENRRRQNHNKRISHRFDRTSSRE